MKKNLKIISNQKEITSDYELSSIIKLIEDNGWNEISLGDFKVRFPEYEIIRSRKGEVRTIVRWKRYSGGKWKRQEYRQCPNCGGLGGVGGNCGLCDGTGQVIVKKEGQEPEWAKTRPLGPLVNDEKCPVDGKKCHLPPHTQCEDECYIQKEKDNPNWE